MSIGTSAVVRGLSREESLRHLHAGGLCSIAVTDKALPVVVTARFALARETIYVKTGYDSLLARAAAGRVVGCGMYGTEDRTHQGWSVSLTAIAEPLSPAEQQALKELATLRPWADSDRGHMVLRLATDLLTGQWLEA